MHFVTLLLDAFVGIVAGILTAAFLYVAKHFIEKSLLPAYRENRYRGVILDGSWYGLDESRDENGTSASAELTLNLVQRAHDLSGKFRLQFDGPAHNFDLTFDVSGYIWEGYITLNLRPSDRTVTSYATGLLKVGGGGTALIGKLAYREVNFDQVKSLDIFLGRGSRDQVRPQIARALEELRDAPKDPPSGESDVSIRPQSSV